MNKDRLTQIFLDQWKGMSPQAFRAKDPAFLKREAGALADQALAEIKATIWPGQMPEVAWSEISSRFLSTPCPKEPQARSKA